MNEYNNEFETMQALLKITEGLLRTAYDGISVILQDVVKNNGIIQHGFTVHNPAVKSISPTIYVDEAAKRIMNKESDLETEASKIKTTYDSEFDKLTAFNSISDYLKTENFFVTVVNAKLNRKHLKDVVHSKVNDLSLVLRCRASDNASFAVKKVLLSEMHLTASEAMDIGINNTISAGFNIEPMEDVLMSLMSMAPEPLMDEEVLDEALHHVPPRMYVVTSKDGISGASSMFINPEVRNRISELMPDKDCIVLPSSTFEAIILPADKSIDAASLLQMVHDVNKTLNSTDVLSESIYLMPKHSRELQTITVKSLKVAENLQQSQSLKPAISM